MPLAPRPAAANDGPGLATTHRHLARDAMGRLLADAGSAAAPRDSVTGMGWERNSNVVEFDRPPRVQRLSWKWLRPSWWWLAWFGGFFGGFLLAALIALDDSWHLHPSRVFTHIRVIDGDTVRYQGRTVRLVGFDTPETGDRARCEYERTLGAKATSRLRDLLKTGPANVQLVPCACPPGTEGTPSCNYGRACGVLTISGRDVGAILIAEGLARPLRCGAISCPKRVPWC
jgi:Staphylococcal nuclease homologue